MKKNRLILTLIILIVKIGLSQDTIVIDKFKVDEYYLNGELQKDRNTGHFFSFLLIDDSTYFVNALERNNTRSIGKIEDLQQVDDYFERNEKTYTNSHSYFTWHYKNSYDGKEGVSKVFLNKIFLDEYMFYRLQILTKTNDTILLTGKAFYNKYIGDNVEGLFGIWQTHKSLFINGKKIKGLYFIDNDSFIRNDTIWYGPGLFAENFIESPKNKFSSYLFNLSLNILTINLVEDNIGLGKETQYRIIYQFIDKNNIKFTYNGKSCMFFKE